ncbi:OmpA family protein [Erythrobacter sp. Dej080120_24]|uniref:OmpA family protein n=1 Tax=Erythrobacter sp. Dej080120_24 TaxID=3024837 RepID=UPI0030C768EF
MTKTRTPILTLALIAALGACAQTDEPPEDTAPTVNVEAEPTPEASETISILRTDIEQPDEPEPELEPLELTIGFPAGRTALDTAAVAQVQAALASEQIALGGPIILRGHSDAGGNDAANLRASRARAETVRDWLVENGIAADRIEIIAFGEQNPVEPNALPDGSPNAEGRAANRRVEIEIALPAKENPIPAISAPADES